MDIELTASGADASSAAAQSIEVALTSSTATSGTDFTFTSPTTVNIPAADYSTPQTLTFQLTVVDDDFLENTENIILDLQNPSILVTEGPVNTATINILDDDNLSVSFTETLYTEDEAEGSVGVTVQVSGADSSTFGSQTINLAILTSTATNNVDYTFTDPTTITIPASDYTTPQTISTSITLIDDGILEGNEDINFVLNNPSAKVTPTGDTNTTVTILDDETASVQFETSTSNTNGDEDNAPAINLELSISATTGSGTIATGETITTQVAYNGSSTATNGSGEDIDFTTPQTITFTDSHADGELLPISFILNDDNMIEDAETAIFNLSLAGSGTLNSFASTGTNTQHTLTIEDDDGLQIEFDEATYSFSESTGTASIDLSAFGANTTLAGDMTIDVQVLSSTATNTADYTFTDPTTVTIPANDYSTTQIISFNLPIIDDGILEGNENLVLQLTNPNGILSIATVDTTTITIQDDETAIVQFEQASTTISQATGPTDVNVQLNIITTTGSGTIATGETITAQVAYNGSSTAINGPGEDIEFTSPETITFTDSNLDGDLIPITYTVNDDNLLEDTETAIFDLTIGGSGTLNSFTSTTAPTQHTLNIEDDDKLLVEFTSETYTSPENVGDNHPTINIFGAIIESDASIEIADLGTGTATEGTGNDYTFTSPQTITIPADDYTTPQTISLTGLTILDNADPDGNRTINFALQNPSIVEIGDANTDTETYSSTTYTILDDELLNVQVEQAPAQDDPTNQSPVYFTLEFTDPIDPATLEISDLSLTGSTATNLTIESITEIAPNDDTTFQVEISSDLTQDGDIILSLPAGVVDISGGVIQNEASNSTDNTITIDTEAPANPLSAPDLSSSSDSGVDDDEITNDNTPEISGTCTAGDTVVLYADGSPTGDEEVCGVGDSFQISYSTLAEGDHDLTYIYRDPAGNESAQSPILFITIDTLVDPVVINSPVDGSVVSQGTTYSGTCETDATIYIENALLDPNPTTTECESGTYSTTITWDESAANSTQDIEIYQIDLAGNTSAIETIQLDIDVDAPQVSFLRDQPPTKFILGGPSNSVLFNIITTEDVFNADADDFAISTTVDSYTVSTFTQINNSTYTLLIENISGFGTMELQIDPDEDITDEAGNLLDSDPITSQIYEFVTNSKDDDGDGIPSWLESSNLTNGENPDDPTTSGDNDDDGDQMPNGLEVYISNLACFAGTPGSTTEASYTLDSDLDGIPDWNEIYYDSDPCDNQSPNTTGSDDTDADGITDSFEIQVCQIYPTLDDCSASPVETRINYTSDTDGDGIPDQIEILANTDPTNSSDPSTDDTDSDGVTDGLETILCRVYNLCPALTAVDSDTDTDGGGTPDYLEIQSATDPNEPSDDVQPESSSSSSGGGSSSSSSGSSIFSIFSNNNTKDPQTSSEPTIQENADNTPTLDPTPITSNSNNSSSSQETIVMIQEISQKIESQDLNNCIAYNQDQILNSNQDSIKLPPAISNLLYSNETMQGTPIISGQANTGDLTLNQEIIRVELVKTVLVSNCLPILPAPDLPELNRYGQPMPDFKDLPISNTWVSNTMYSAAYYGLINGDMNQNARPADEINLAEFIKVSVLSEKIINNQPIPKPDIQNEKWYEVYIPDALNSKIITPQRLVTTRVDQPLKREFVFQKIWNMIIQRGLLITDLTN